MPSNSQGESQIDGVLAGTTLNVQNFLFDTTTPSTPVRESCQDYYSARYFVEHLSIYSPNPCPIFKYNAHPPISILLYLPFNALPLQLASFIWSLLSLVFYLVAGFLLLWVMGWM